MFFNFFELFQQWTVGSFQVFKEMILERTKLWYYLILYQAMIKIRKRKHIQIADIVYHPE